MPFVRELYKEEAPTIKVYSHFAPWSDCSKSVHSNQKLDRSTEVTKFGLAVDERTRNNLTAHWSELTWNSLEWSNYEEKWLDTIINMYVCPLYADTHKPLAHYTSYVGLNKCNFVFDV